MGPKSCGTDANDYSEAIDLLVAWVAEDAKAVAKAFDVQLRTILDEALTRARAEASLFDLGAGDSEDRRSGSTGD